MVKLRFATYPSEPEQVHHLGPWELDKYADYTTFVSRGRGRPIAAIRLYNRVLHSDSCSLSAMGFGKIWTEPEERGAGVGKALHDYTIDDVRSRGCAVAIGVARFKHFLHGGCNWQILGEEPIKKDQYLLAKPLLSSINLSAGLWWFTPDDLF